MPIAADLLAPAGLAGLAERDLREAVEREQPLADQLVHRDRGRRARSARRRRRRGTRAAPGPSRPRRTGRGGPGTRRPRPRARRRPRSSTSAPSRSQRPSRSIRIRTTSCPAASRPSATDAPERSDTSCSEERPPERTATLIGRSPGSARRRRDVGRRLLGRRLDEHGDEDRHPVALADPGAGRRRLVE